MIRTIIILMMSFLLVACSSYNERYYLTHLQALQQRLDQCPAQEPQGISCRQLEDIASQVNDFSIDLRTNPQQFGKEILALQEVVVKQEEALKSNVQQSGLKEALHANKKELEARLAVVRWLESPGG